MKIKLIDSKNSTLSNAAAKSCYQDHIIPASDKNFNESLMNDLFDSGHHTTFQHKLYTFSLEGISRYLVWSLLHAHPYFNTSQVSQRYVKLSNENVFIPPGLTTEQSRLYTAAISDSFANYKKLSDLILPKIEQIYYDRFCHRAGNDEWKKIPQRISYENARYVMPLAATCHLYYSIDLLTLLRLKVLSNSKEFSIEAIPVIDGMIEEVLKNDKRLKSIFDKISPVTSNIIPQYNPEKAQVALDEFDRPFNKKKFNFSYLLDYMPRSRSGEDKFLKFSDMLGFQYRFPSTDKNLLNIDMISRDSSVGEYCYYTFAKKMSISCDSQAQRHRTSRRITFPLLSLITKEPDYYIPNIFKNDFEDEYKTAINDQFRHFVRALENGISEEIAVYLLPNATNIRLFEICSLNSFRHKARMRLCFNAQEEIWKVTAEEAKQIQGVHENILSDYPGHDLVPGCISRFSKKEVHPCREGKRYCGIQAWRMDYDSFLDYEREY